jgi:mannose-6-phosphate isomerase-like protein (cupin superfamily)
MVPGTNMAVDITPNEKHFVVLEGEVTVIVHDGEMTTAQA